MTRSDLEFRVLGPIEVARAGVPIDLGRPKARVLLAYLAMRVGSTVTSDEVLDALWPDSEPERARNALWVHVSSLRKALEPERARRAAATVLVTHPGGYRLDVEPHQLDAVRFEQIVHRAEPLVVSDPDAALRALEEALELWRGRPYDDVYYADFVQPEIRRLEELRLTATEQRLRSDLALGNTSVALDDVARLVDEHPLREGLHGIQMLAWYRAGEQTEALRTYQRFRRRLADELGIDPSPALRRLEARILVQDPTLATTVAQPPTNLPSSSTRFIGRQDEIAGIRDRLRSSVLLTLTGQGGVGKTRLAIEVGQSLVGEFADGVWFADLASLSDARLVAQSVASAVRIDEEFVSDVDSLAAGLVRMNALIVLDNCEHVADACATLVGRATAAAPNVSILATSRSPLGVVGEHVWRVDPLDVPAEGLTLEESTPVEAMRLLVEAVAARDRSFVLTDETALPLGAICRYLDGVPLALELAAAQVAVLGPAAVAQRLPAQLDLLHSDRRHENERHRSLTASIEWSYQSLAADEQCFFNRLSVFRGSFDLDAAEAVTSTAPIGRADVPRLMNRLVNSSLVQPVDDGTGRRFRMLVVLRQYAARAIAQEESDVLGRRHADYFRLLSVEAGEGLTSGDRPEWLDRIAADYDNLRAAITWSLAHDEAATAMQHLRALTPFWSAKSEFAGEGHDLARRMLDNAADAPPALRARARMTVAAERRHRGDLSGAAELATDAIALLETAGEPAVMVDALNLRGLIALVTRDDEPFDDLEQARALAESCSYTFGLAHAEAFLGYALFGGGRVDAARAHLEQACANLDRCGRGRAYAGAIGYLGRCAHLDGDDGRALDLLRTAITIAHRSGTRQEATYSFNAQAVVHLARGDDILAVSALENALQNPTKTPMQVSTSVALVAVALLRHDLTIPAAELLAASAAIRERSGFIEMTPFTRSVVDGAEATVRKLSIDDDLVAATARGRQFDEGVVVELARSRLAAVNG